MAQDDRVAAILFDAMETIVEIAPIPDTPLRMAWLLERSGYARSVCDEASLTAAYTSVRPQFDEMVAQNREYRSTDLFNLVADEIAKTDDSISRPELAADLNESYEIGYFSHCTVASKTEETLKALSNEYTIRIVSNMIIPGGLQRFLRKRGLYSLFDCIITSVDIGWRKPAAEIYSHAARALSVHPHQTIFIGDDVIMDFETPLSLGFRAIHYAPDHEPDTETSIQSLSELPLCIAPVGKCQ